MRIVRLAVRQRQNDERRGLSGRQTSTFSGPTQSDRAIQGQHPQQHIAGRVGPSAAQEACFLQDVEVRVGGEAVGAERDVDAALKKFAKWVRRMTEGGVGRDYLLANGVPYDQIIAETESVDTEEQVTRLAEIARERHLNSIVLVSDGTHLFRIRKLCEDAGLIVYTSPRGTLGHIDNYDLAMRYFHEMLSYTALRLNMNFEWMHGKSDT